MRLEPRGPDAMRERMAEIRARLREAFPERRAEPTKASVGNLSGAIGEGGYHPLDPLGPGLSRNPAETPDKLKAMIEGAAGEAGVDPQLLDALVLAESSYDPRARSHAGAMGLTQLMPGTATSLGVANPWDPAQNLRGGARYLAQMLDRFGGDPKLALAAYNAGPGAVERHGGIPPYAETRAYVDKVLNLYEMKRRGT